MNTSTQPLFKMSDLLAAGVHYGHRTFRWNPQMAPFIYGSRNGIHVIDLRKTTPMMNQALQATRETVAKGGRVLFVGTKRQAQQPVAEAAERCGMYYVNHRWLGGMLTNWKTVSNSIRRLKKIEEDFEKDAKATAHYEEQLKNMAEGDEPPKNLSPISHLTKKERLMLEREHAKLDLALGGIKNMNGLPDMLIVLDVKKDRIAVEEANCLGIPVAGIVDTNSDVAGVEFPIPGNDDATRAISLYAQLFSDAVLAGIEDQASSGKVKSTATIAPQSGTAAMADASVTLSPAAQKAAEDAETQPEAEPAKQAPAKKADTAAAPAADAVAADAEVTEATEQPATEAKS